MSQGTDAAAVADRVRASLRDVVDFPKPGIVFKDIAPVLGDALLLRDVVALMAQEWRSLEITHVAGIESRGFILAAPIAIALGAGFIPIRKPGKLPFKTHAREYALEYGSDRLEVHVDACPPSARVLIVDDVLATGGTARTACELVEQAGGKVLGCSFLIAIAALDGHSRLPDRTIRVVLTA